jgi:hypothetical protein
MATTKEPMFHIGQPVNFKSFINHNGKRVERADGLTVVESELVEGRSIPNWYRVKAVSPDGSGYFAAAERFFEPSTAVPADLAMLMLMGWAGDHVPSI